MLAGALPGLWFTPFERARASTSVLGVPLVILGRAPLPAAARNSKESVAAWLMRCRRNTKYIRHFPNRRTPFSARRRRSALPASSTVVTSRRTRSTGLPLPSASSQHVSTSSMHTVETSPSIVRHVRSWPGFLSSLCLQKTPSRSSLHFSCWIPPCRDDGVFIAAVDSGVQRAHNQLLCGRILLSSGEFVA